MTEHNTKSIEEMAKQIKDAQSKSHDELKAIAEDALGKAKAS